MRITGIIVIAAAIAVAALFLGRWQYHRYEVRADALSEYNVGLTQAPLPLDQLIPVGTSELPLHVQWREAVLVGQFEPDSTTVLRNRPVDGTPSWQYLAWFDTTDGRSMLVNVGWVPLPGPDAEPSLVPYPTQETTITVITRAWEDDDGNQRRGAGATRITPAHVPEPTYDSVPGYGMLREVCVGDECANVLVGALTPLPSLSTGPHLSYAWQWWVLAALAPVGAVIMIRRERTDDDAPVDARGSAPGENGGASAGAQPATASSARKSRKRGLSDEDVEDAL